MYKSKPMDARRHFPNSVLIIIALVVISGSMVILLRSRSADGVSIQTNPQTNPQANPVVLERVTKAISSDADTTLSLGDMTLYVPTGATNLAGFISINPGQPNLFPAAGEPGWTRPVIVSVEYRDNEGTLASGISFLKLVQICFKLNDAQWQDFNQRLNAYQVQYYAENLGLSRWIVLPRVTNPDKQQVCGAADHLSMFALAIKPADPTQIPSPTLSPTITPTPTQYGIIPTPTRKKEKDVNPSGKPSDVQPPPPPPPPPPPKSEP